MRTEYTRKQKVVVTGIATSLAVLNMMRWYRLMRVLWRTDGLRESMERIWSDANGGSEAKPQVRPQPEEVRPLPRKRTARSQQGKKGRNPVAASEPTDEEIRRVFGYDE